MKLSDRTKDVLALLVCQPRIHSLYPNQMSPERRVSIQGYRPSAGTLETLDLLHDAKRGRDVGQSIQRCDPLLHLARSVACLFGGVFGSQARPNHDDEPDHTGQVAPMIGEELSEIHEEFRNFSSVSAGKSRVVASRKPILARLTPARPPHYHIERHSSIAPGLGFKLGFLARALGILRGLLTKSGSRPSMWGDRPCPCGNYTYD